MKIKTFIALSVMASLPAFANPTDKSLEELSKYAPYEALFYGAVEENLIAQRERLMYDLSQNTKLTNDERNKALQTYDTYAEGFFKNLNTPAVKAELKKSYLASAKSVFNQNEVNAQIAFYGSTDGQNALKNSLRWSQPILAMPAKPPKTRLKAMMTSTSKSSKKIWISFWIKSDF